MKNLGKDLKVPSFYRTYIYAFTLFTTRYLKRTSVPQSPQPSEKPFPTAATPERRQAAHGLGGPERGHLLRVKVQQVIHRQESPQTRLRPSSHLPQSTSLEQLQNTPFHHFPAHVPPHHRATPASPSPPNYTQLLTKPQPPTKRSGACATNRHTSPRGSGPSVIPSCDEIRGQDGRVGIETNVVGRVGEKGDQDIDIRIGTARLNTDTGKFAR
jgi:hypothetical protein